MSLKPAFAAVLKAMRNSRGLTQKHLSEASSRTYLSKLERGQSSLTLDKLYALSQTLELSPITLVAITLASESRVSLISLMTRAESELLELRRVGVLRELEIDFDLDATVPKVRPRPSVKTVAPSPSLQTELYFSD